MSRSHTIATLVAKTLEETIEQEPIEVFLAFAGLFCTTGVHLGVPEEDAMNLIRNVYKDTLAEVKKGVH